MSMTTTSMEEACEYVQGFVEECEAHGDFRSKPFLAYFPSLDGIELVGLSEFGFLDNVYVDDATMEFLMLIYGLDFQVME